MTKIMSQKFLNWAPLFLGALFIPLLKTQYLFDYFTVIKWFAVHTLALIALVHLFFLKEFPKPKLPSWVWLALSIAALIFVWHLIQGHTRLISMPVAERISLTVLCFYFFILFRQKKLDLKPLFYGTLISTSIVVIYGLYQIFSMTSAGQDFSSTFGNTNMTAQFLGFSLLIQVFSQPWEEKKHSKWNYLRMVILFLTVVYLTMLMCRSIFLGLALCTPFLFFKTAKTRAFLLCALAVAAFALGIFLRAKPAEQLQRTKQFELKNDTTNERFHIWKQSLSIVQDKPFGMGPAAYEFGSAPYAINTELPPREDLIYRSPHNEFLRFSVEDGILFLFLMVCVWGWLLFAAVKRPFTFESMFLLAFATLWITETIFQFPFENAYPTFLFSVMAGRALSINGESKKIPPYFVRAFSAALFAALLFVGGRMLYSKYHEATANGDAEKNLIACQAYPDNWRSCLAYSRIAMDAKKWKEAEETLRMILDRNPYNFSAIQMWSVLAFQTNHPNEGCVSLWIFDQIFSGRSSMHDKLMQYCKEPAAKLSEIGLPRLYPVPFPKLRL